MAYVCTCVSETVCCDRLRTMTAERDQLAAQVAACGDAGCPSARDTTAARRFLLAQKVAEALARCDVDWQTSRALGVKDALDEWRKEE